MKIVNAGEALILQSLIDNLLDDSVYHLYQNNVTVTAETVLGDLEEADYSGYTADDGDLAATGNTWGTPTLQSDGRHLTTGDVDCEFVRGAGATDNTIYGLYLTNAGGDLIAIHRFANPDGTANPFPMEAEGATIRITPKFSFQTREEIVGGPFVISCHIRANGQTVDIVFNTPVYDSDSFQMVGDDTYDLDYASGFGTATITLEKSGGDFDPELDYTLTYTGGSCPDANGAQLRAFTGMPVQNDTV